MMPSKIEYCDETLEVTGGCTKRSPGCTHCWAIKEVWRMAHNPLLGDKWKGLVEKKNGVLNWTGKIKYFPDALEKLRKKPTTYFVDSKADLFHKDVPFEFIDKVRRVVWRCPQHTFLILTKRPKVLYEYCEVKNQGTGVWPNNVHFGGSISTQKEADEKIPILLQIPTAVRFLSIEPMLGAIDLTNLKLSSKTTLNALNGWQRNYVTRAKREQRNSSRYISGIDWVVVGCESGPKKRPISTVLVRDIVDQCEAANVPVFVKQVNINGKVVKMPKGFPQEYPN